MLYSAMCGRRAVSVAFRAVTAERERGSVANRTTPSSDRYAIFVCAWLRVRECHIIGYFCVAKLVRICSRYEVRWLDKMWHGMEGGSPMVSIRIRRAGIILIEFILCTVVIYLFRVYNLKKHHHHHRIASDAITNGHAAMN